MWLTPACLKGNIGEDMSEDERDTFKVTDRRLFNPDGSPRDETPESPPVAAEPDVTPEATPEPTPEPETLSVETDDQAEFPQEGDFTEFMSVLMEVATPAFIHLGMAEHPATG